MKFSNDDYEFLANRIKSVAEKNSNNDYAFYADKTKLRFRWDLFWASKVRIGNGVGIIGDINGNYEDSHIDTALRKIVKKLNLDHIGLDHKA